ncbi:MULTISPECIES: phage Gp37/Gp68 family protein [Burkholderia]|uniref:Phage Gp37/Gp68 family protein n=1 Tax=Burkholderia glumae TaxID=337 RepID=A0AAP9Y3L1_BURGL|nr:MULTISPECIES: phage Gp37/Gp68 family protein [Burkholderia]ACR29184.1 phage Gp37Gp68 family protein [Burkholderia glumae BGR1]AJY67597.1 phage Gp37/Gp68 family protein [Burkholderia glumae LMG 2196 = ATCC 33617]PNL01259.1 phage Gp37/Gp68 family protein [Burkholderia glumae]QPQ93179.1 phage Gp37/Gp68 family protein [Burkholderia glumae]QQM91618.1 phage Gp37/Gp68 family protein [Burkholderia glumae]
MSENSKIEWCDHTFNPWIGCTKISPGCDNCYAEAMMDKRMHKVKWGASALRARTTPENWRLPVRWNARHDEFMAAHGRRQRVFCSSLADVFDNRVPSSWRRDLFALIKATPNLDWLLLTKRTGNAREMLIGSPLSPIPDNVWLGATIVNQEEADRDIPKLLAVPARVRFLSIEPMLGPIDLNQALPPFHCDTCDADYGALSAHASGTPIGIDWVIAGGESGHRARPAHPDWFRSLRDQCAEAHVAFFFKQWGQWAPGSNWPEDVPIPSGERAYLDGQETDDNESVWSVGKRAAGRLLDGRTHDEFPVIEDTKCA